MNVECHRPNDRLDVWLVSACDHGPPEGRSWQLAGETEWHNLVAFNRTAEFVRDYVKKGDRLYSEGKIQMRSRDDKNFE